MRTGAAEAEANHIHVAAEGELGIGTGTFHQSTDGPGIQLRGDDPAQAALPICAPNQFAGRLQPMSTTVHVTPSSVETCVSVGVIQYHQDPYSQPAI
jgi:hypothetical protein